MAGIVVAVFLHPVPQPEAYHHFADQRTMLGVTRALDVLSNFSFLLSGALGLWFALRAGRALETGTRLAFATLFLGLVMTSAGSAYYHLSPDNQRLVFDRLPMIIAMSGCTGALLADRFGGRMAWSIPALGGIGLWTVHYWSAGETAGHGDLRWYLLYQGLTIVVGALLLLLFPSRNGATQAFVIAVAGNVAAKVFEFLDQPIYAMSRSVSGHTLKHLSAGLAFLPLALLMRRIRKPKWFSVPGA